MESHRQINQKVRFSPLESGVIILILLFPVFADNGTIYLKNGKTYKNAKYRYSGKYLKAWFECGGYRKFNRKDVKKTVNGKIKWKSKKQCGPKKYYGYFKIINCKKSDYDTLYFVDSEDAFENKNVFKTMKPCSNKFQKINVKKYAMYFLKKNDLILRNEIDIKKNQTIIFDFKKEIKKENEWLKINKKKLDLKKAAGFWWLPNRGYDTYKNARKDCESLGLRLPISNELVMLINKNIKWRGGTDGSFQRNTIYLYLTSHISKNKIKALKIDISNPDNYNWLESSKKETFYHCIR